VTKIRVALSLLTILVVGVLGIFVSLYARGYRFNLKSFRFAPNGLLVVKSDPSGAQVFINGELKTATDTTISLSPGVYDVEFRKDGFFAWRKRLQIDKEVVTQASTHLFKMVPALSPVTFSGSISPVPSNDFTKIAYSVPASATNNNGNSGGGLWVVDTVNLPLGFNREPRQITDGDMTGAVWQWSPDTREIMLTTPLGVFILDAGTFTAQDKLVNITSKKDAVLIDWQKKADLKLSAQLKNIDPQIGDILKRKAKYLTFSPDETKLLYQAAAEAEIPTDIVKQLPGASTQKQERKLVPEQTYVYDIKEDRNFLVEENPNSLAVGSWQNSEVKRILAWFPTSGHLVMAEEGKVSIMDYDGTNREEIYTGSYITPNAYPILSTDRILILTNLGASDSLPNLYAVTIK